LSPDGVKSDCWYATPSEGQVLACARRWHGVSDRSLSLARCRRSAAASSDQPSALPCPWRLLTGACTRREPSGSQPRRALPLHRSPRRPKPHGLLGGHVGGFWAAASSRVPRRQDAPPRGGMQIPAGTSARLYSRLGVRVMKKLLASAGWPRQCSPGVWQGCSLSFPRGRVPSLVPPLLVYRCSVPLQSGMMGRCAPEPFP
jgi:hypothetical protein